MGIWLGRIWSARGAAIPRRESWFRLAVSFTGYLMCACVLATAVAKGDQVFELGLQWPTAVLAWSLLSDLLVFLGLAGLFALVEARWARGVCVTGPVAFAVAIYVALNTAYLIIAGEQGSWQALLTLEKQFEDVRMVFEEAMSPAALLSVVGTVIALSAGPIGLRRLARRRLGDVDHRVSSTSRAQAALPVAAVAALGVLALPGPRSVEARALGDNCVVKFARTAMRVLDAGKFEGYAVPNLVDDAEIQRFAAGGAHPNVLLVVLESTRFDFTSLAGRGAKAETPRLAQLAERGLTATRARAFVPHTTKSLFGMLCGRYPTMQRGVIEVADNDTIECVPSVLRDAGYRTGFFQSAFGTFEQRPRLASRMGFDVFRAWESIRGRKLGYLASDDRSLTEPFRRFVDEEGEGPFFATVLTSATHHPYRLPGSLRKQARLAQRPAATDEERYARLVESEDDMLGTLLDLLEERGLLENTIVIVLGDHGEGFGAHGVRQHDNNFYEEGLHVPFVIAGPGVPVLEYGENVSLIDLTPTLLGRLGIAIAPETAADLPGFDVLGDAHPGDELPRPFACYSSWKCRGFVVGHRKVVYVPEDDTAWYFDLELDPFEHEPLVLDWELESMLDDVHDLVTAHRTRRWQSEFEELRAYDHWWCMAEDGVCLHPRAYKTKYRYVESRGRPVPAGELDGTESGEGDDGGGDDDDENAQPAGQ